MTSNTLKRGTRQHTTHYACPERMSEYGIKCVGCCCTGHQCESRTPTVAGEPAGKRLMKALDNRRFDGAAKPNANQVAMVLHALADHTAIMEALKYRPDLTSPWPEATSIGRWMHDTGDQIEEL